MIIVITSLSLWSLSLFHYCYYHRHDFHCITNFWWCFSRYKHWFKINDQFYSRLCFLDSLLITFIPHLADYWNRSFYHLRLETYTKKYTATTASINIYPVWLHSVRHVEHITWIITPSSQILFFVVIPLYRTVLSLSSFTSLAPGQHIPDVDEQVWWI